MSITHIPMILVQVPVADILWSFAGRGELPVSGQLSLSGLSGRQYSSRDVLELWMGTGCDLKKKLGSVEIIRQPLTLLGARKRAPAAEVSP
jgi:hypothetical protein